MEQRTYDSLHLMGQMTASESPVTSVAMSRDQKYAACGTKAGVVALWDLEVCQCVWTTVQSRKEPVTVLHLTQDSMRLLSGNSIGVVSIWDMANGALIRSYEVIEIASPLLKRFDFLISRVTTLKYAVFKRLPTITECCQSTSRITCTFGRWSRSKIPKWNLHSS